MGYHLLDVADISLDILQIPTEHHPRFSYSMGICDDCGANVALIVTWDAASNGSTYVLVDCCNDRDALEHIHKKLDKDMEAVDQASCKIDNRLQVLQRFSRYRRKRK